jgi:hypothetical protein
VTASGNQTGGRAPFRGDRTSRLAGSGASPWLGNAYGGEIVCFTVGEAFRLMNQRLRTADEEERLRETLKDLPDGRGRQGGNGGAPPTERASQHWPCGPLGR